jgi:hypothetical protein
MSKMKPPEMTPKQALGLLLDLAKLKPEANRLRIDWLVEKAAYEANGHKARCEVLGACVLALCGGQSHISQSTGQTFSFDGTPLEVVAAERAPMEPDYHPTTVDP